MLLLFALECASCVSRRSAAPFIVQPLDAVASFLYSPMLEKRKKEKKKAAHEKSAARRSSHSFTACWTRGARRRPENRRRYLSPGPGRSAHVSFSLPVIKNASLRRSLCPWRQRRRGGLPACRVVVSRQCRPFYPCGRSTNGRFFLFPLFCRLPSRSNL